MTGRFRGGAVSEDVSRTAGNDTLAFCKRSLARYQNNVDMRELLAGFTNYVRRRTPRWDTLAVLGQSRAVKSSYMWLFIVPPLAKALAYIPPTLSLRLFGRDILFQFDLPFSWKAFYFSAVSFAVATAVFSVRCPRIIKEHTTAADFVAAGKGYAQIVRYADEIQRPIDPMNHAGPTPPTEVVQAEYWLVREKAAVHRAGSRLVVAIFDAFGLALIGVVLLENFRYVARLVPDLWKLLSLATLVSR